MLLGKLGLSDSESTVRPAANPKDYLNNICESLHYGTELSLSDIHATKASNFNLSYLDQFALFQSLEL